MSNHRRQHRPINSINPDNQLTPRQKGLLLKSKLFFQSFLDLGRINPEKQKLFESYWQRFYCSISQKNSNDFEHMITELELKDIQSQKQRYQQSNNPRNNRACSKSCSNNGRVKTIDLKKFGRSRSTYNERNQRNQNNIRKQIGFQMKQIKSILLHGHKFILQ